MRSDPRSGLIRCVAFCVTLGLVSGAVAQNSQQRVSPKLFPVKPVDSGPAAPTLSVANGHFFSYALPQGWRVMEDGQFALTLAAPDNHAFTVMVGNSGFAVNYPPARFVYEKLMALQPENLQLGPPRQVAPIAGFTQAYQYEVSYAVRGVPCRGIVKCNVFPAYDSAVMVMTAALSQASQWQAYASWLPLVADQISATNGAAFGRRGIMAQNLKNSVAFGEAAQKYRDWSQKNWQGVVDDRNRSTDERNHQVRENLGGVQTYVDPFAPGKQVELPATFKYVWSDNQGHYMGSDDPSANPNVGSTVEWTKMPPRGK